MKTLLFIEDDKENLEVWSRLIERLGFKVFPVASGEEGVEIYKKEKTDIVFLDLLLPGMNGEEVFKKIKEINPQAEIYIISGHTLAMAAVQAHDIGADGYFTKPIILDDLKSILKMS